MRLRNPLPSLAIDGEVDIPIGRHVVLDKHVSLSEALCKCLGPVAGSAGEIRAGVLG